MLNSNSIKVLENTFPFWDKLTDSQKEYIIENSIETSFKKGNSLHGGDSDCIGVLIVKKGTIRTYMISDEGREITLYRLDDNEVCVLSASCILQTITFDVFVDAETDCEIIQINSAVFSKLSSSNIYVENYSYKLASERFSDVMWAFQQILFISFDKRLAGFLLDESIKTGSDVIHMTHEQIAKYLSSAREVVSRMLNYFSREQLVSLSRGGITLVDKQKLKELVFANNTNTKK